jgi:hypothetical protein
LENGDELEPDFLQQLAVSMSDHGDEFASGSVFFTMFDSVCYSVIPSI